MILFHAFRPGKKSTLQFGDLCEGIAEKKINHGGMERNSWVPQKL